MKKTNKKAPKKAIKTIKSKSKIIKTNEKQEKVRGTSLFGKKFEKSLPEARKWAKGLVDGAMYKENTIKYINDHLDNITYEELMSKRPKQPHKKATKNKPISKANKTIKSNTKSLVKPKKDLKSKAKTPKSANEKKCDKAIYLINRIDKINKKHLEMIEKFEKKEKTMQYKTDKEYRKKVNEEFEKLDKSYSKKSDEAYKKYYDQINKDFSKTKVNTFLNYKDGFTDKKYVRDLYLGNKSRSKNVKK